MYENQQTILWYVQGYNLISRLRKLYINVPQLQPPSHIYTPQILKRPSPIASNDTSKPGCWSICSATNNERPISSPPRVFQIFPRRPDLSTFPFIGSYQPRNSSAANYPGGCRKHCLNFWAVLLSSWTIYFGVRIRFDHAIDLEHRPQATETRVLHFAFNIKTPSTLQKYPQQSTPSVSASA